jgi:predicted permease
MSNKDGMRAVREWVDRLRGSISPRRSDRDLEEELRSHLELAQETTHRDGGRAEDPARMARLEAGGVAQAMDELRDQRGLPWLEDMATDTRHALRILWRSPSFAGVVLLTLALGIGANTAIFSILNSVILQPLDYPRPDQLMRLTAQFPVAGSSGAALSYPEYLEFREMNRSFADVGAFTTGRGNVGGGSGSWTGEVNVIAGNRPLRVRSAAVDEHLLRALGVAPESGRLFAAGETDAMAARPGLGGPPIAILSHELWQAAFGGQPLVGQTVIVDGRLHEIIGVMPPGLDLMDTRPEIWLPLGVHPVIRQIRTSHLISVIGRLKEGVTRQQAEAELTAFIDNWGERTGTKGHLPTRTPSEPEDHTLQIQPLQDAIVGSAGRAIWVLQAAVGFILLIVCANLANLALARAESRRREFTVRTALGASRGRLLRQTLTEGILLSVAGGAIGVWVAQAGLQALVHAYPASVPRASQLHLDLPVMFFALAVSLVSGVLFGLAPVAQWGGTDLVSATKHGGNRTGGGGGRHRLRRGLVMAEIALALMLVTGAGLMLRTVYNLTRVDAGFDRSRLVTFSMTLPRAVSYPGGRVQVYRRLLDTLRAVPGVQAASGMSDLPLNRFAQRFSTRIDGETGAKGPTLALVDFYQFVMSDYFETMGIPIVAGRRFEPADAASLDRVVIVSEALAYRLWKGRNPIGQRLRPNLAASMGTANNPWHTVIGVAKDVKEGGVDQHTGTELYLFSEQPAPSLGGNDQPWVASAPPTMNVVLRTSLPVSALSPTFDDAVRRVDPGVPVVRLREMDAVFAESIRRPSFLAQLLGVFAGLALVLAAVGTCGVLSHMVSERRREIGIRMALGASRSSVVKLTMAQGLQLAAIGVIVGIAGVMVMNQVIASLLFGVEPTDAATLASVVALLVTVAAMASWFPAWRAARVDPNVVLRTD